MLCEPIHAVAASAAARVLKGSGDIMVRGHFTDTRHPVAGGLFIALRGDNFDGHAFAREAIVRHGAAAVLVDREAALADLPPEATALLVEDSRQGYLNLAAAHRCRLSDVCWIGITGSVGKSTTKEMIASVLAQASPKRSIHKAEASFNNEIGLSKTILETAPEHDCVVLELGTNHPGEIERLAQTARPNIAVITCAAESHLEAFGSVANVAREKGAILKFQSPGDTAILNADDPHFELWRNTSRSSVLSFGLGARADVQGWDLRFDESGCARFNVYCAPLNSASVCALKIPGSHLPIDALAAIAAALATGVSLDEACAALSKFKGLGRRFTIHQVRGTSIVDDAYNANPTSFRAAVETLRTLPAGRRFVVAGGMLELGERSAERHRDLGKMLAGERLQELIVVGELGWQIGAAAVQAGMRKNAVIFEDSPESAALRLKPKLKAGDAVLVKGSHGVRLEGCVKGLLAE